MTAMESPMKRLIYTAVVLIALATSACSNTRPAPVPTIPDKGQHIQPLPGCQDLRERGGSC